jgi:precorrin-2 dehydrogenase/sirohydrochlorin ferrochelatase
MRYYPIYLDIKNRKCLVVGGGSVGARKVQTLLTCGAKVTVVSPDVSDPLKELSKNHLISLHQRPYRSADLKSMFLVIGATNSEKLNHQIRTDAECRNILCNIVDRPQDCNFILPSIISRGDLTISISTSGKSPALAKKLRKDLSKQFGEEYALFLKLMGQIRKTLLIRAHEPEAHKQLFEQLINRGLLEMIRDNNKDEIDSLLYEVLGEGFAYAALIQPTINDKNL